MIRSGDSVVLVDTGIGLHDIADPEGRIGSEAINAAGFQFLPPLTAVRQLERLGISPASVTDIVLTHCDPDHAGGLSDFPGARVHVSTEEKANLDSGNVRYSQLQFSHGPTWITYDFNDSDLFGLPTRRIQTSLDLDIRLVPLFGHTLGHCGVAIIHEETCTFHVGDAYYLREELQNLDHPVNLLAALRADNDQQRLQSLDEIRRITQRNDIACTIFGYHDVMDLPAGIPLLNDFLG